MTEYKGPCFSPSQTAVFKECPLAWYFRYRQRYVPRTYSEKEIAGAIGIAFSTFQEFIDEADAEEMAQEVLRQQIHNLKLTRSLTDRASGYESTAPERLARFIRLYKRTPLIPSAWTLYDRERSFTNFGNCRVDSMYHTSMGEHGVLDYKTRGSLRANQRDKARREFATSNQMFHYCWAGSQVYGKPIDRFSILIVVLDPKPFIDLWQYRVKPSTLEVWAAGRKQDWQDMQDIIDGKRTPSMAVEHENKYGKCQYYDICFKHGFDEDQVQNDFLIRS